MKNNTSFEKKMREWNYILFEDALSIESQIYEMLFNDAYFHAINHIMKDLENSKDFVCPINNSLSHFLFEGYVHVQLLSIRRLVEPMNQNDNRQPNSIKRLLKELISNHSLITRENFVCGKGYPYDYEAAEQKYMADLLEHYSKKKDPCIGFGFEQSKLLHEKFDRYSGVSANKRCRKDLISKKIIMKLENMLAVYEIDSIEEYVNKVIAHAADRKSRFEKGKSSLSFTINQIHTCQDIIYQVAKSLCDILLSISLRRYPCFEPKYMDGLILPYPKEKLLTELSSLWNKRKDHVNNLKLIDLDNSVK